MLTSSGQAATLLSILNLCSAGDSFISVSTIYGGTVNLFAVTLKNIIECIWVDQMLLKGDQGHSNLIQRLSL